jgi:hypothetical protein
MKLPTTIKAIKKLQKYNPEKEKFIYFLVYRELCGNQLRLKFNEGYGARI